MILLCFSFLDCDYGYDYGYGEYAPSAGGVGGYGEPPYYDDFYAGAPSYDDYGYDYGYSSPPRPYPPNRPPPPPPPAERVSIFSSHILLKISLKSYFLLNFYNYNFV